MSVVALAIESAKVRVMFTPTADRRTLDNEAHMIPSHHTTRAVMHLGCAGGLRYPSHGVDVLISRGEHAASCESIKTRHVLSLARKDWASL